MLSLIALNRGRGRCRGHLAGGGVEFAILPNWSVKAEYLYVNFNNQTIGPGTFTLIENVVRGSVNYRFWPSHAVS